MAPPNEHFPMSEKFAAGRIGSDAASSLTQSDWSLPETNVLMVGALACIIAFVAVISVFMYHRERIRRFVTGENRRVGSVYYVRPGISATQPIET